MVDTRCANPEYQLDVDVMVLEYTVYKAIEAQLAFLKALIQTSSDESVDRKTSPSCSSERLKQVEAEAVRLHKVCDSIIQLFHINHPSASFSPETDYSIKILELIILLGYWISSTPSADVVLASIEHDSLENGKTDTPLYVTSALPNDFLDELKRERALETALRRVWLVSRSRVGSEQVIYDFIGEGPPVRHYRSLVRSQLLPGLGYSIQSDVLDKRLTTAQDESGRARHPELSDGGQQDELVLAVTLFDLLPRFMDITVGISRVMGNVNNHWIQLACRFMCESAFERMRFLERFSPFMEKANSELETNIRTRSLSLLEQCFAWGFSPISPSRSLPLHRLRQYMGSYQDDPNFSDSFLHERLHTEDLVCAMLNTEVDMRDDDQAILETAWRSDDGENPAWTRQRASDRSDLLKLYIKTGSPEYRELLRTRGDKRFSLDLVRCIEGFWHSIATSNVGDKPVLIQIEEGGLSGLNEPEFKSFLSRAGLKISEVEGEAGAKATMVKWSR